jgi:hypothetical protein
MTLVSCGDDDGGGTDGGLNHNQSQALCGNGALEGLEECDDGPQNSDLAPDACRSDCTRARCGDGVTWEPIRTGHEQDFVALWGFPGDVVYQAANFVDSGPLFQIHGLLYPTPF